MIISVAARIVPPDRDSIPTTHVGFAEHPLMPLVARMCHTARRVDRWNGVPAPV
jgi:hypothetical protein